MKSVIVVPALFIAAALFFQGCASEPLVAKSSTQRDFNAAEYRKVAVTVSTPNDLRNRTGVDSTGAAGAVESAIQSALLEKGYEVAERSEVERVLKEINFQGESGMTKEQQAKLGEAIGCKGMMVVTLNNLTRKEGYDQQGGRYITITANMSAKLLDLKKCTTVWTASSAYPGPRGFFVGRGSDDEMGVIDECSQAIARTIPTVK